MNGAVFRDVAVAQLAPFLVLQERRDGLAFVGVTAPLAVLGVGTAGVQNRVPARAVANFGGDRTSAQAPTSASKSPIW